LGGGLSDDEIEYLLANDMKKAERTARKLVKNFDSLSDNRKVVILDLAFNLGETKLAKFVNTLKAINEERWNDAAKGMENSLWYNQVGNRSKKLVKMMKEG
jgi:lysozyme